MTKDVYIRHTKTARLPNDVYIRHHRCAQLRTFEWSMPFHDQGRIYTSHKNRLDFSRTYIYTS